MSSNVKLFKFPKFEDWINSKNHEYQTGIGVFKLKIGEYSWIHNNSTIAISLSADDNPLDMYSNRLFYNTFDVICNVTTKEDIRMWYEEITHKVNEFWENYIKNVYLKEDMK